MSFFLLQNIISKFQFNKRNLPSSHQTTDGSNRFLAKSQIEAMCGNLPSKQMLNQLTCAMILIFVS